MACPNFKNGPKTGLCPLGVKGTLPMAYNSGVDEKYVGRYTIP
jgi:hypothetical protein